MDILLTHGYFLYEDPHELAVMKPYPPLGLLYINSHLKARGVDSRHLRHDLRAASTTLEAYLQRETPPVVGIYSNLMTRRHVLVAMRGRAARPAAASWSAAPTRPTTWTSTWRAAPTSSSSARAS